MNSLESVFKKLNEENKKAVVPYIMAGDGGIECLIDRLLLLEKKGATSIEIGIPFSDPVADGPTIQKAGIRALKNGITLKKVICELEKANGLITVPLILMTYLNPVYSYGLRNFVNDIKRIGISGVIIPDLPLEEEDIIAPLLENKGIELIRLVTLTTPLDRIKIISEKGNGFLYAVTIKGITGVDTNLDDELISFLKNVRNISKIPVLAGFGISNKDQISALNKYCDGVIIGSKIIEIFNSQDNEALDELIMF